MDTDFRPVGRPDVEAHLLPDGTCLLFDLDTGRGHVLNSAGALAWDYCEGSLTADEIAREIATLMPAIPDAYDQSMELLEIFAQQGLLVDTIVGALQHAR